MNTGWFTPAGFVSDTPEKTQPRYVKSLGRGVNRGMHIRRSVVFLGPIRRSDLIFVQIRIRVTLKIFRGI